MFASVYKWEMPRGFSCLKMCAMGVLLQYLVPPHLQMWSLGCVQSEGAHRFLHSAPMDMGSNLGAGAHSHFHVMIDPLKPWEHLTRVAGMCREPQTSCIFTL